MHVCACSPRKRTHTHSHTRHAHAHAHTRTHARKRTHSHYRERCTLDTHTHTCAHIHAYTHTSTHARLKRIGSALFLYSCILYSYIQLKLLLLRVYTFLNISIICLSRLGPDRPVLPADPLRLTKILSGFYKTQTLHVFMHIFEYIQN